MRYQVLNYKYIKLCFPLDGGKSPCSAKICMGTPSAHSEKTCSGIEH